MRGSVELSLFTCWGRLSLGSLHSQIRMYNVDAEDPDVNEYQHLPDTEALAERLDPIDWATYEPYLWGNAARCYQRSAVLLGSLVQVRSPQSR